MANHMITYTLRNAKILAKIHHMARLARQISQSHLIALQPKATN
jgi:hypothetical protein